jgi:imidazolonepropionase-like amidohydrolase
MSQRVSSFSGALWFALLATCGTVVLVALPRQLLAEDLAIEHVTVVSPERSSALPDAVVRVHDGRIASVSSARSRAQRAGVNTTVIDGTGLFAGTH